MNHSKVTYPEKREEGHVSLFSTARLVAVFTPVISIEALLMTILTG